LRSDNGEPGNWLIAPPTRRCAALNFFDDACRSGQNIMSDENMGEERLSQPRPSQFVATGVPKTEPETSTIILFTPQRNFFSFPASFVRHPSQLL
jgi:hypothetical protein